MADGRSKGLAGGSKRTPRRIAGPLLGGSAPAGSRGTRRAQLFVVPRVRPPSMRLAARPRSTTTANPGRTRFLAEALVVGKARAVFATTRNRLVGPAPCARAGDAHIPTRRICPSRSFGHVGSGGGGGDARFRCRTFLTAARLREARRKPGKALDGRAPVPRRFSPSSSTRLGDAARSGRRACREACRGSRAVGLARVRASAELGWRPPFLH